MSQSFGIKYVSKIMITFHLKVKLLFYHFRNKRCIKRGAVYKKVV